MPSTRSTNVALTRVTADARPSYPTPGAVARHEAAERSRIERRRRMAHRQEEERRRAMSWAFVMSALMAASVVLASLLGLGGSLAASIGSGLMLGSFVDLVTSAALVLPGLLPAASPDDEELEAVDMAWDHIGGADDACDTRSFSEWVDAKGGPAGAARGWCASAWWAAGMQGDADQDDIDVDENGRTCAGRRLPAPGEAA